MTASGPDPLRPVRGAGRAEGPRPDRRGPARTAGRLAAAAALALAVGCGGRAGDGDPAAARERPDRATVPAWTDSAAAVALDSLLRRVAGYVGTSRARARERLGPPEGVRRRTVPNRHVKGAVDTLVRLSWDGASASFHKSGANQREFLGSAEITAPSRIEALLPPPLRSRRGVLRILGDPDRVRGARWVYVCCPGRAARESLALRLREGRVVGLRAGYFVD